MERLKRLIVEAHRRSLVGDVGMLSAELAREMVIREGIKAVLEGDVTRAGAGYVLTAILRHAETGQTLAPLPGDGPERR